MYSWAAQPQAGDLLLELAQREDMKIGTLNLRARLVFVESQGTGYVMPTNVSCSLSNSNFILRMEISYF